jgi:hypothetical protein
VYVPLRSFNAGHKYSDEPQQQVLQGRRALKVLSIDASFFSFVTDTGRKINWGGCL